MGFCGTCGAPLQPGAGFCMQCGTQAGQSGGVPPQQQMGPPQGGGWQGGGGGGGAGGLFGMLAGVNKLTIQQQFSLMEAATGTMGCGCCETLNTYKVFDGNSGQPLAFIEEKADLLPRACCAPNHSLLVHFYTADSRGNKGQPIMTMERPGCPWDKPCVGVAACGECCLQEMTLHEGFVEGDVGQIPKQNVMGSAKVPEMGGFLTPSLELFDRNGQHLAMVEKSGQCSCLFGGLTEMCCDQPFSVTRKSDGQSIANIIKTKPKGMSNMLQELMSDADTFTLEITDPSITPEQKASLLGSLVMLDYMFFERDSDGINCEGGDASVNCCNFYFMGCIIPCKISGGGGSEEGGGGGGGGGDGGGY